MLGSAPLFIPARYLLAMTLEARGQIAEALGEIETALEQKSDFAPAQLLRASLLQKLGRMPEALETYESLLTLDPNRIPAWNSRGMLLKRMGRHLEALESFDRCLALDESNLAAHNNRANILREMGQFEKALADYSAGLKLKPNDLLLRLNRASLLLGNLQRAEEAADDFEAVLALDPGNAKARNGLVQARTCQGIALSEAGRLMQALDAFEAARHHDPLNPDVLEHLGSTFRSLRRFGEAKRIFDSILVTHPDRASTLNHRGAALLDANYYEEALADFDAALVLEPENLQFRLNRAIVLSNQSRHGEAIIELETVLAADAANPQALGMLAGAVLHVCDWTRREKCAANLSSLIERQPVPPLTLTGYSDDPALLLRNAAAFTAQSTAKIPAFTQRPPGSGRIRVAYLSADFRPHPIAYQIANVIEHHDRSRFEIIGIAMGTDFGTPIRARLEAAFDEFHDVAVISDERAAMLLRELNTDIAIDLHGHTLGGRLGILARRPASVQVTWLGYPGTTGGKFIDYVIGDPETTPMAHQQWFSENIAQLPRTYMPNDSSRAPVGDMPARASAGLPDQGFVFCCFNHHWKITPALFEVWMRLLLAIPESVLWLRQDDGTTASTLRAEAAARDVDSHRLIFAPRTASIEDHIARMALADLFLDTVPYNAHATACDALWAGLPVLTCRAGAFAGRVGAGLLNTLDLRELISDDLPTYEAMARDLGQNPARLNMIRQKLKGNLTTQKVFDSVTFTRDLEAAFTAMIERARAGKEPQAFQVHR
ncbi:MAG: tetratricopeptide repeat protein [Alphaproteobacteria bacterium]|nr:tetratricopeptide repeat protein [Alphaproteobacteria bacterium]